MNFKEKLKQKLPKKYHHVLSEKSKPFVSMLFSIVSLIQISGIVLIILGKSHIYIENLVFFSIWSINIILVFIGCFMAIPASLYLKSSDPDKLINMTLLKSIYKKHIFVNGIMILKIILLVIIGWFWTASFLVLAFLMLKFYKHLLLSMIEDHLKNERESEKI